MVLRTAIELDLLELIKKLAGPAGGFVSPADIAAQLPAACTNPAAHIAVDRILRLLASYSILNCTLKDGVGRVYSLAPVCKYLTKNEDGVSMAPLCLLQYDKASIESWYSLKDVVLEYAVLKGGEGFAKTSFEFLGKNPSFNNLFNQAMSDHSTIIMNKILDKYDGFDGLKSLVDVGGGTGAALGMIASKYPSIKGINFDLAQVIQTAPTYPGVEHVAGDMFVSVPKGDAIFMKWVCHDWNDEECLKILKNCYKSLPRSGKVILAEYILPDLPDNGRRTQYPVQLDLILMAYSTVGGKERSENEFHALAKGAGFKEFKKVCCAHNCWILELHK
ncbi:caffeic acid 3-o-methyltransferase 1 [Phtheirospermum japonicum]|uniref:Caffeic acid 3-o-methyltransferase 1 n=1 Tax=Phtheirospermum japonicum TaxID=374723 RepID=A0A830CRK1_9LAMI|nr:caffeic acid 3-o-methyltransferase 1 [Phtheirospermum japonicum]